MAPRAAFLSFRFGTTDGVSAVARTWQAAFESFGFTALTVAGEGQADRVVSGFGLTPGPGDPAEPDTTEPDVEGLERALADVDLVVVENLLTIPLNLPASAAAAKVLAGRPALLHHHDPPWHRARFAHVTDLPADDAAWRHVAINEQLAAELAERGLAATVIYNAFDPPGPRTPEQLAELRAGVRGALGVDEGELLVAHPVRAIERKDVPAAVRLCEELGATYWLLGPAEEGYGPTLEQVLGAARCRVVHRSWDDRAGIYAAADHVTFPSTWEGFGNPPIEAALHRRTVSVGDYPVAAELRAHGFEWFAAAEFGAIGAALADPDSAEVRRMLDRNEAVAREHFGIERMRRLLRDLLDGAGWLP
jgi:glycosyltransferase involved in cell wall biosynthesis